MSRLPAASRETVAEDQREIFDQLVEKLGAVPPRGPGSIMIHVPEAYQWATGLNSTLRNHSSLPKKIQELAMLVTARALDCQYVWNAHAPSAREAGVPDSLVDALREKKEPGKLAPDEAAVVNYAQEWYKNHRVSRGAYQAAQEQFGNRGLVELTLIMGNYSLVATLLNSFDAELPPDRTEPMLPVS